MVSRIEVLKEELNEKGMAVIGEYLMERLPKLLYAVGSSVIPRAGNAIERFFRQFRHFQLPK